LLQGYAVADLLLATGIPRQTLYDLRNGNTATPTPQTLQLLHAGLPLLDRGRTPKLAGWREIPRAWLAKQTGIPRERLQVICRGTRAASQSERERILAAAGLWQEEQARAQAERDCRQLDRYNQMQERLVRAYTKLADGTSIARCSALKKRLT